jgi:hypothetical protein
VRPALAKYGRERVIRTSPRVVCLIEVSMTIGYVSIASATCVGTVDIRSRWMSIMEAMLAGYGS